MKRRISSTLMALVLCLTLLPAAAYADGGTAVYVSGSSGSDGNGGTQTAPYATLAKAVEAAEDGATIYVMSDLTMTDCARFYSKSLTITSGEGALTLLRATIALPRRATTPAAGTTPPWSRCRPPAARAPV